MTVIPCPRVLTQREVSRVPVCRDTQTLEQENLETVKVSDDDETVNGVAGDDSGGGADDGGNDILGVGNCSGFDEYEIFGS